MHCKIKSKALPNILKNRLTLAEVLSPSTGDFLYNFIAFSVTKALLQCGQMLASLLLSIQIISPQLVHFAFTFAISFTIVFSIITYPPTTCNTTNPHLLASYTKPTACIKNRVLSDTLFLPKSSKKVRKVG